MKLYLFTIGKAKTKGYDELCAEYEKRIRAKLSFEAKVFATEKALLKALNEGWEVILLDERGVLPKSSGAFARILEQKMLYSGKELVFVIGGSHGLGPELRARGDSLISLSPLTFPHKLARLVMTEQLYRALTIIHGEPYHH